MTPDLSLTAKLLAGIREGLMAEGFTREEAMQIVVALAGKPQPIDWVKSLVVALPVLAAGLKTLGVEGEKDRVTDGGSKTRWYTVPEAAQELRRAPQTVHNLLWKHDLPRRRIRGPGRAKRRIILISGDVLARLGRLTRTGSVV